MKRYNLSIPRDYKDRDGNEKTAWDNVGVMFKRDKGGYSIRLSMFPDLKILAFDADDKPEPRRETPPDDETDDIPF